MQSYSVITNKALLGGGGKWRCVHNQASRETGPAGGRWANSPTCTSRSPCAAGSGFWPAAHWLPLRRLRHQWLSHLPVPRPPPAAVSVRIHRHTPCHPLSAFWRLTPKERRMGQESASTEDLLPQHIQHCRKSPESQSSSSMWCQNSCGSKI